MPIFAKESLENLRQRINLLEVLNPFVDFKAAGAAYKALCPFHEEKTPSFVVQKGDSHYHCFGCGAHGDAIAFLMGHQKLTFSDAVEYLAEKFHVHLEAVEKGEERTLSKKEMREALTLATAVYHTLLLHTQEGEEALCYLYKRGLSYDFIKHFEIGYAPSLSLRILPQALKAKNISLEIAEACCLVKGGRDFFHDRILFPIRSSSGHVIGFSGRKFKEETPGGKYVNTAETPLFKKSRVLFGLNYSKQKIAKERLALVVEGQIDALRLIHEGLDITVAAQGTAFGQEHVHELANLGILKVYLSFDSDQAGLNATAKVGDLFQREGIEAKVVKLPEGYDPDRFVREKGIQAFSRQMEEAESYLSFLIHFHSSKMDIESPAGKNELAIALGKQIRAWDHPVLVHESLKQLAQLLKLPESMVGVGQMQMSHYLLKKHLIAGHMEVDPDWVIETDVLRWLIKSSSLDPSVCISALTHLTPSSFHVPICQSLYILVEKAFQSKAPLDLLGLICQLEEKEGQHLMEELTRKKIILEKARDCFLEALQRMLDRNWMAEREKIRSQIQSGSLSDDEALELAKKFERVKRPSCIPI